MSSLSFVTNQFSATFWTMRDKMHLFTGLTTCIGVYAHYFRDYLPSFFHVNHVPDMKIQTRNDIGIMQRSTFDDCSSQLNGIQIGYRSHCTRPSYLISHLIQSGTSTFSLELVCDSPARRLSSQSKTLLLTGRIDFQNNTICCDREILSFCIPVVYIAHYFLQRTAFTHVLRNLKAPFPGFHQIFVMTVMRQLLTQYIIEISIQFP